MKLLNYIDAFYVYGALISLCFMAVLLVLNYIVEFARKIIKRFRGKSHG